MADSWHVRWLLEGNPSWNDRRKRVSFVPDLSGIDLAETLLQDGSKPGKFNKLNLTDANLTDSDLHGLSLRNTNFRRANLTDSKLDGADVRGSNFREANLTNVSAIETNFRGSKFIKARVSGANFLRATAENADFSASNLSARQAISFHSFSGITLPEDLDFRSDWPQGTTIEGVSYETIVANIHQLREIAFEAGQFEAVRGRLHHDLSAPTSSENDILGFSKESDRSLFDVYYGTNRKPIFEGVAFAGYGTERSKEVEYGVCEVFVPEAHKVGSLGSGRLKRWLAGDDRVKITKLIQLNRDIFWKHLKTAMLKKAKLDKPMLFVHGFNNTFEQAALRSAQIGYDLGLSGGIGLFSWPSFGTFGKYTADEAAMESSKYQLAEFIEGYVDCLDRGELNLLAHSMGCRCLLLAIEVLAARQSPALKKIGHVILAAADVDQGIMPRLGATAVQHSKRTTSYASVNDVAVELSGWLHSFPRVGFCPPVFVMEGIDSVVVNNTNLIEIGHGYVSENRDVLSDMFNLLAHDSPPDVRFTLQEVQSASGLHWKLKD